ncbi:putative 2-phosphosulfolactate phosphatase [Botrimarina colliarenosi]|uniref:Probable 2-phosphosulfolactate phosphatase n=1 Tax=Botrimarina colliarenosi TaxID=2528001 RepID=A0A5C6AD55_9BACT|nr:2-phosphosulfolactate phosphatase [Botrimarina colliarenosi]TWT97001.1 putative 2-phosphosulfolactate phosphatase [Botrimarina colliarenosi]
MSNTLAVHYLPQFVAETDLAGETVVVIDLLRASTTICQALASGARDVTAFLEVGDVVRAAEAEGSREGLILAGERNCQIIDGFDLGNSPAEFTPDEVFGQRVFFTTTNGTRALQHARLASRVVVGAVVNLSAVVDAIADDQAVHLLCAGTNGHVTREDQLAAGAIAHQLLARGERDVNDQGRQVLGEWQELLTTARAFARTTSEQLAHELRDTSGGKNLLAIGMEADLARCAALDALGVVPVYDPATGRLTPL